MEPHLKVVKTLNMVDNASDDSVIIAMHSHGGDWLCLESAPIPYCVSCNVMPRVRRTTEPYRGVVYCPGCITRPGGITIYPTTSVKCYRVYNVLRISVKLTPSQMIHNIESTRPGGMFCRSCWISHASMKYADTIDTCGSCHAFMLQHVKAYQLDTVVWLRCIGS